MLGHQVDSVAALVLLLLLSYACPIAGLEIKIINKTNDSYPLGSYYDDSAAFNGRAYGILNPVEGLLVYPVPRNACSTVDPPPQVDNVTFIAFVEDFGDCPYESVLNLRDAGYDMMIALVTSTLYHIYERRISQALVDKKKFGAILEEYVISDYSRNDTYEIYVRISDDSLAYIRKLMLIFALVLFSAIAVSVFVFCTVAMCRWLVDKWRTRGLTRWRVSQLPKRKYRLSKEGVQACSICLEDYKDKEYIRVLPCNHMFHPKCVDEWLRKWNRTCPLCKTSISRRRDRRSEDAPLLEADTEITSGNSTEDGRNRESYGTMNDQTENEEEREMPVVAIATVHGTSHLSPMAAAV